MPQTAPLPQRGLPSVTGHLGSRPGRAGRSSLGSVWRSTSAFPTPAAVELPTRRLHANLGGPRPPPRPRNSLQGRGEGAAPLREAGEGPCPRQSWFLRLPSRACLPRTVLFVTKDTHSWAFREITTVSLSWGQQRDVCKETLLSEKLNHPARQTEGRASARLLSQAPPKSRAPTAGHGERPSSDTPRGSRRTRHTTHLLTTPALIRLKPPQRALSWGTGGKGGKGPGGHRAGSEGWDARKGCSTRPLLMPLNFWEERSPQIT